MKLPMAAGGGESNPSPPHADPGELAKTHPRLAEAFSASSFSDGSPKRPARLSVSIYGRRWMAQLDLPCQRLMLRVELPDPLLVYDALEAVLALDTVPWEKNPYLADMGNGKKKKT